MATLGEQLTRMKEESKKRIPPEKREIMDRATEDLRHSGILEKALRVGDAAPDFILTDGDGREVTRKTLLGRGWLVLNFYRGKW